MKPTCDFCGQGLTFGETWQFECSDFEIHKADGRVQVYSEPWAACGVCKDLIVAGKRDRLAKRAARETVARLPVAVAFADIERSSREIHDGFWAHRIGAPRPITQEEFDAPITSPRHEDTE